MLNYEIGTKVCMSYNYNDNINVYKKDINLFQTGKRGTRQQILLKAKANYGLFSFLLTLLVGHKWHRNREENRRYSCKNSVLPRGKEVRFREPAKFVYLRLG